MLQWTTTSAASTAGGVKTLIYGASGVGKTMLCATAPRPVIISAEAGLLSLTRRNIERVYGVGTAGITYDIPVLPIHTIDELAATHGMFADPRNGMREHCGTILLDSLSELAEKLLAELLSRVKDPRQAYQEFGARMPAITRSFRDLEGFNVVMMAKQEYTKDEALGGMVYSASMPGQKVGPGLPYFFDEVFCLRIVEHQGVKYRVLQTQPDPQRVAKDRSGALEQMERPDLTAIFNKITTGAKQ